MSSHDLNATAASLLGFLLNGPKTGWDLAEAIEASVGHFFNVTRSQVYRELKTLAAAGLVVVGTAGPRDRMPYEVTAAGRRAFEEWIATEPGGDILRMPIVVRVFFGAHVAPDVLRRHLVAARLVHEKRLAEYEAIKKESPWDDADSPFQSRTLELGLAYEKMLLDWFDSLPWMHGDNPWVHGDKTKRRG